MKRSRSKINIKNIILSIIVVLIISGGGYCAFRYFKIESPESVEIFVNITDKLFQNKKTDKNKIAEKNNTTDYYNVMNME